MLTWLMNAIMCVSVTQISPHCFSSGLQQPLSFKARLCGIPLHCFSAGYESALLEDKQTGCRGTMPGGPENRAHGRKWGGTAEIRRYWGVGGIPQLWGVLHKGRKASWLSFRHYLDTHSRERREGCGTGEWTWVVKLTVESFWVSVLLGLVHVWPLLFYFHRSCHKQ